MLETPRHRSPYGLIQEDFRDEPWKMLVCCICLNLTSIKQVRPVIKKLFLAYPTSDACALADDKALADLLKPLGLYNRRAKTIIKLSQSYNGEWSNVSLLPGVGKYAADSWRIFVDGKIDIEPGDTKLKKYVEWAKSLT